MTADASTPDSTAARVFSAQVDLVYQLTPRNLLASFVVSTLLASLLFPERGAATVAAWWASLNAISAARYLAIRKYRGLEPGPARARAWATGAIAGSLLAGSLWGIAITVMAPPWGTPPYVLVVFIATGVPAAALVANSPLFPVYAAVLLPILPPFAIHLFMDAGDPFRFLAGCLTVIYVLVLATVGKAASDEIAGGFKLKIENADLVERLSAANRDLKLEIERRESAEQTMREAKEVAESANVAKSSFLAKMSHEIRTPMSGVLGMNELLMHSKLTAEERRYAEAMDESARSLMRIIDDILDFSRVEAGKLKLEPSNFDPRDAIARSVGLLAGKARAKGLEISWKADSAVPALVHGDRDRLQQVLVNLIGNAIKFTRSGSVSVAADLISPENPCVIRFRVTDTGAGISAGGQRSLFEPFAQADESSSRRAGGTGLGLAICRQLVTLMGGDIWLEGSTSSGTVFTFTVRFSPPKILSGNVLLAELPLATGTIGSLYGNVLVAEDHPVNAEVAAAHLKSLGLTADIVEEGTAAVAAAARGGYDVILMDCEMPGMDGYEAARTIRKHEEIRGVRPVPIIALTASAMAGDRQKALEAGMDDYVSKPFTRAQLFRALSAWLARSEPARPPA